ncbi:hypothetical protein [Streptomyces sp. LN245]|uniref:hypothetical protein n=1 Tax=Streptomyces sp. LN245 TaxID=3112975 RepID=UPI003716F92E
MSQLSHTLTVDDGTNSPLYKVRVNDGGPDGGSTSELFIGGNKSNLSKSDLDSAVQAFADTLDAVPGFSLVSVTCITTADTAS